MKLFRIAVLPLIIVLLVGFILLVLYSPNRSDFRLHAPFASEPAPDCSHIDSVIFLINNQSHCVCTDKGVSPVGFPFKTNLYDYCYQDESQKSWIVALDLVINLIILITVFRVAKSKLKTT